MHVKRLNILRHPQRSHRLQQLQKIILIILDVQTLCYSNTILSLQTMKQWQRKLTTKIMPMNMEVEQNFHESIFINFLIFPRN